MKDPLPNASIRVSVPSNDFFDRVAILAIDLGTLHPVRHGLDVATGLEVLSLRPIGKAPHDGLFGQLIYTTNTNNRIIVEVRADRWGSSNYPTYDSYVEAINFVFKKLLSQYNKRHSTRHRLTIVSKKDCEPSLSPNIKLVFDKFVAGANKASLHPCDWERFYKFARLCHRLRAQVCGENVFRLLVLSGFSEEYSRDISIVFTHLQEFQRAK